MTDKRTHITGMWLRVAVLAALSLTGGCVEDTLTRAPSVTALAQNQPDPAPTETHVPALPAGRKVALVSPPSEDTHVRTLNEAMVGTLKSHGYALIAAPNQVSPEDDLYFVSQVVDTKAADDGGKLIAVSWVIADANGDTLGKVEQKRLLDASTDDDTWSRAATLAAAAAAEGVNRIISEQE